MKLAFVADVHLGNHRRFGGPVVAGLNTRARMAVDVLRYSRERAEELGADTYIVLGDLFDNSKPEPQLIAEAQRVFDQTGPGLPILLMGNHDQNSTVLGDHALGPLKPVSYIVEHPDVLSRGDVDIWCVPFQPGRAFDWLPEVMRALHDLHGKGVNRRVLTLHLGLQDERTPPWLRNAHDSVPASLVGELCRQYGIDAAFAGNWHNPAEWDFDGIKVIQPGTLCPTGWDNPGEDYGRLCLYDTVTRRVDWCIINGPRFLKLKHGTKLPLSKYGFPPFVQLVASADDSKDATEALRAASERGELSGGEVVLDDAEATAAAKTAATVARSASTLAEALAGYVAEMPVADGVDRQAVLALAKQYLGSAQ